MKGPVVGFGVEEEWVVGWACGGRVDGSEEMRGERVVCE